MTEADMVDILDYLCNAAFAWLNDAKSEQSYGSCDWTDSAFERLHWKLKMPQGDSICLDSMCMSSPALLRLSLLYNKFAAWVKALLATMFLCLSTCMLVL